jgi:ferric-dicitrate binding protein FerR (iron transport regulator)
MNRTEQHPDSLQLDRLRAGLLDDEPREKTTLEQHLQHCERCRHAYDWPAGLRVTATAADQRLDRLRREVMATPSSRPPRRWAPLAAAAALALLAVSLYQLVPAPDSGAPQVAASSPAGPDLYEDLDFYLWLADHKSSGDSST